MIVWLQTSQVSNILRPIPFYGLLKKDLSLSGSKGLSLFYRLPRWGKSLSGSPDLKSFKAYHLLQALQEKSVLDAWL